VDGQAAASPVERVEEPHGRARAVGSVWLAAGALMGPTARLRPAWFADTHVDVRTWLQRVLGRMVRLAGEEWTECALVILLALCTGAFTMVALAPPMRWYEVTTYLSSLMRPWYLRTSACTSKTHVLHSVLSHCSTRAFGSSPWAILLPASLAGVAVVRLDFVALRRHLDPAVALVAAPILATSVYLIDFGSNARGYTIVTACSLCLLLLARRLTQPRAWVWRVLFVVFAAP
jgi:hypothetical protein